MSMLGAVLMPHPPVLLPEVGRGRESEIAATERAMRAAAEAVAHWAPDVLVVASPHTVMYSDYFHISPGKSARGDMSAFGAPQLQVETEYDAAAEHVRRLRHAAAEPVVRERRKAGEAHPHNGAVHSRPAQEIERDEDAVIERGLALAQRPCVQTRGLRLFHYGGAEPGVVLGLYAQLRRAEAGHVPGGAPAGRDVEIVAVHDRVRRGHDQCLRSPARDLLRGFAHRVPGG